MYPYSPGHRNRDTSRDAANAIDARTLRQQCLGILKNSTGLTADEVADKLNQSVLAIRPRITELNRQGFIMDSGTRRLNRSGKNAIVWSVKMDRQPVLFDVSKDGTKL